MYIENNKRLYFLLSILFFYISCIPHRAIAGLFIEGLFCELIEVLLQSGQVIGTVIIAAIRNLLQNTL